MTKKITIKKFKNPYSVKSKYQIELSGIELFDIEQALQDKYIYLRNRSLKIPNDGIRFFSPDPEIEKEELKNFSNRLKNLENDLRNM